MSFPSPYSHFSLVIHLQTVVLWSLYLFWGSFHTRMFHWPRCLTLGLLLVPSWSFLSAIVQWTSLNGSLLYTNKNGSTGWFIGVDWVVPTTALDQLWWSWLELYYLKVKNPSILSGTEALSCWDDSGEDFFVKCQGGNSGKQPAVP